ncbi:MAG: 4-alpha-glucanotransferase [Desulfatibacillaceae bacterium]
MKIRSSGILLHVTSLPSRFGIGDVGPEAHRFADYLERAGQTWWQVLPLSPTDSGHGDSPYHSVSAFGGNPLLISPELLAQDGLLDEKDLPPSRDFPSGRVDFELAREAREPLLDRAYERFARQGRGPDFQAFCQKHARWLDDHAMYVVLKEKFEGRPWNEWDKGVRNRRSASLKKIRRELAAEMDRERFFQYVFFDQWHRLKRACSQRGITLFGDLPIYLPYDSADVWANPGLFRLDKGKKPVAVSGVPSDYFSETGQLWGHPVYDWEAQEKAGFDWWASRMGHNFDLYDVVRIDHFRGLVAYWEVPAGEETAINGEWVEAPADKLFAALARRFACLPVVAEDLGTITADVREAMQRFEFPGMRILLFAFGDDFPHGSFLPHNNIRNCVVYTGTHDNNTARGWYEDEAGPGQKRRLALYLGRKPNGRTLHHEMVRMAMASVADTAIIPMQDVLGLGGECRMNRPAGGGDNWTWRLKPGQATRASARRLRKLAETYGRL